MFLDYFFWIYFQQHCQVWNYKQAVHAALTKPCSLPSIPTIQLIKLTHD
jgi:hypothetical protein